MDSIRKGMWLAAEAIKGNAWQKYRWVSTWQWMDAGDAKQLQLERLRALIRHAASSVPYYRDRLSPLSSLSDLGTISERFSSVPLLDKASIKQNYDALNSSDFQDRGCTENTSGGSTGQPVRFVQDSEYREWNRAVKILFDAWTGYELGQAKVGLWGSERDLWVGRETIRKRLRDWVRNETWLNTFRMSRDQNREYVSIINRIRPRQITSYVESAYDMARTVEAEGVRIHSPAAILTTGGTLYPDMRRSIESAFRAPVFNRYGSREVGDIACECDAHLGLHVASPTHYVELLDESGNVVGPGQSGEVVVTLLTNWSMPLIRYRIGDTATWSDRACTCGRSWPLLADVHGRTIDIFVTSDGSKVHAQYFIHLFYFQDWVEKFQVIQRRLEDIEVIIVPKDQRGDPGARYRDEIREITDKVRFVMGRDCRVSFEFVSDIPPSRSGKYRYTISHVVEKHVSPGLRDPAHLEEG